MNEIARQGTTVGVPRKREEVIDLLNEAYARDIIELEEYEKRVELAHQARYIEDLDRLTADLPGEIRNRGLEESRQAEFKHKITTILGSKKCVGQWLSGQGAEMKILLGDATLDLRNLNLPAGITEIKLNVILGNLVIIAPPGLTVENYSKDFLSSVITDDLLDRVKKSSQALIRITGRLILSSLNIKVK